MLNVYTLKPKVTTKITNENLKLVIQEIRIKGVIINIWLIHRQAGKKENKVVQFSSVQFICSVMSDSLWPHGLQHLRLPCPSPTPGACSNSCPSMMSSSHLILCHPLLLPSIFPSIRVFSNESALHISPQKTLFSVIKTEGIPPKTRNKTRISAFISYSS